MDASAGPGALLARKLQAEGIRDAAVLAAVAAVDRALFLPDEVRSSADQDAPLLLGDGQTTSRPFVIAAMLEALALRGDERALEVGTGCGYQTALLARLLPPPALVRSIEVRRALLEHAADALRRAGATNVELRLGDGAEGWPEAAPFDAVVVCAAPAAVPTALLDQLAPGGRLVLPVGPEHGAQVLEIWRRDRQGRLSRRELMGVRFVPLVRPPPSA